MATKKMNIEELKQQCLEAEKTFKLLREQLEEAEKKEEEEKKAKLEAEKQKRYDEVVDAYNKFEDLRKQYVCDYGSFSLYDDRGYTHTWFHNHLGWF